MLQSDPRFTESGLHENLVDVMVENGAYDVISHKPSYWSYGLNPQLNTTPLRSWNRPTLGWKIECEEQGKSREEGYTAAQTDLKKYELVRSFWRVGLAMVIIFTIMNIGLAVKMF